MANNNKQNIAKHVINVRKTTFSAEKYTYPTNLYAGSSPYLHSSANTFGSAARTLWTPLQGVTLSLWDDGAIPALIQKQQKRESDVYAHFNSKDEFFSLLTANNSVIEATNLQAIDASYEEAFKIINDNLADIINSARNYIGYKKSYSSQDMKTKTLQLAKFISKKFGTNEEISQQLMDLFKYSPRKNKKEENDMKQYFFLRALREYAKNKQQILNATELNKYIETEYVKSWSGKINNLVGDYGEKQVAKVLEEMFKGTDVKVKASGRDKSQNASGKQQTNVGDIMLSFGDIDAALSVKTTGHYKRKESKDAEEVFDMSDFKFRDTSAEALLKYYNNNSALKDFLRYLLINIMFFKGGESNPVFVGQSGVVSKSGLKAVENIVNDIISVTLPFIMLNHSTPELTTDFIINARTGEITPASVLLERIYVATKHYDERQGGYRAARGLVTVSGYRADTEKMNERKAAELDSEDTNFSYPNNLLKVGQEYGAAQWNGGKGLPLSIRISQVKEKIQELERQALL